MADAVQSELQTEWEQFKRRITGTVGPGAFNELVKYRLAELVLTSTDPDLDASRLPEQDVSSGEGKPKRVRGVKVRVEIPKEYPQVAPRVTVLSKHEIQPYLTEKLETFLKQNEGYAVLRPLVKWADRCIGEWRLHPSFSSSSDLQPIQDNIEAQQHTPEDMPTKVEQQQQQQQQQQQGIQGESVRKEKEEQGEREETEEEEEVWTVSEQVALEEALRKYPATIEKHKRWRYIGAAVEGKSKRECIRRFEKLRRQIRLSRGISPKPEQAEHTDDMQQEEEESTMYHEETESVVAAERKRSSDPTDWTKEQQEALDSALIKYPNTMDKNERWKAIGKSVPGKTKRDCIARFKYLREEILKNRAANSTEVTTNMNASSSEEEEEDEEDEGEEEFDEEDEKYLEETEHVLPELNPEERGVKGVLTELSLTNIGWCYANVVDLHCTCENCGTDVGMNVNMSEPSKQWCSKCSSTLSVEFHPTLIHSASIEKLGFFDVDKLIIQDLTNVSFRLGCFECSAVTPTKPMQRAKPFETDCRHCHTKLRIVFYGWKSEFVDHAGKPQDHHKHQSAHPKVRRVRDPAIVPGKPLPDEGTCKHYKKSHRWLRFPCCGMAFPCDICHDEKSGCAETKWATAQICGFCAREQPFSNSKPCTHCGKSIGATTRSSHWEGGKGCRNQVLMNKNDSRKYRNSKLKTKSKKSLRVGPKASGKK